MNNPFLLLLADLPWRDFGIAGLALAVLAMTIKMAFDQRDEHIGSTRSYSALLELTKRIVEAERQEQELLMEIRDAAKELVTIEHSRQRSRSTAAK